MLLTCPECHTQYNLDPARVSPEGQTVRCTRCGFLWDFHPREADDAEAVFASGEIDGEVKYAAETDEDITAVFERNNSTGAEEEVVDYNSYDQLPALSDTYAHDVDMSAAPEMEDDEMPVFVHKDIHVEPPATHFMDHQPLGLTANQFGAIVFSLFVCVSISAALLAKSPIIAAYKPALAFYNGIGAKVPAPGEGTRFSDLSARILDGDEGSQMMVEARISNISHENLPYPSLQVEAVSAYGAVLKEWSFHPEHSELVPEETIPIKFAFDKVPEDVKTINITAIPKRS